jgi:DNA-binding NtrC family response regulator
MQLNKKIKILIVDDEPDILNLLTEEFKCHGHYVNTATSGNEAVELLKNVSFDIIISDFRMPNGNGMVLLNFVNSMNKKPVFYFVSGQADLSAEDCLRAGAKQFFAKPFDLNLLIFEVEKEFSNSVEVLAA